VSMARDENVGVAAAEVQIEQRRDGTVLRLHIM
jgi:hypothetical protein